MEGKQRASRVMHDASRLIFCALCCCLLDISQPILAQDEIMLTLEKASKLVLENNEKVLKAQKVLERAKANLKTVNAVYLPQIGLTGFYERQKNDDLDLDERDYLSSVSLSQVITEFGEVPRNLDEAQEFVRKSNIALKIAEQEVIFTLRRLWHNITLTEEEIQQRSAVETTLQEKLKVTKRKHTEKRIPILSVLNTDLELAEQQLALNELRRRLDIDKAELIRLTGLDVLATVRLSGPIPDDELHARTRCRVGISESAGA